MPFPIIPSGTPSTGYQISRSLRFRSSASAYLNRTPSSAGNRRTWTWSGWLKLGSITANGYSIFGGGTPASNWGGIEFDGTNGVISVRDYNGSSNDYQILGTPYYRDYSAWYHLVVKFDDTQATSANRLIIYINGSAIAVSGTYPAQNTDYRVNSAAEHRIMRYMGGAANYMDGYLAEVNFIDGQALTPSSFGAYDTNGVWQPIAYTGSYSGTNSFYLKFTTVGATSGSNTGYGQDFSGNGNYWTTNNLSSTSGTTYDSMLDSPTNAAGDIGNYCVMNPLDKGLGVTVADGNLSGTFGVGSVYYGILCGSMGVNSGKWYWEAQITANGGSAGQAPLIGITDINTSITSSAPVNTSTGVFDAKTFGYYGATGVKRSSAGNVAYGATFTTGNIIGVALDMDAGTLTFYKDNLSQGTAFSSGISGNTMTPALIDVAAGGTDAINFGQRPFAYTPPSGFLALNTQNLPTPTIKNGAQYMAATTYTGNGSSFRIYNSANNTIGTTFQPDFIWVKARSAATNNQLVDAVRGYDKYLASDATADEQAAGNRMTAFQVDGFSVGTDSQWNGSSVTLIGWQWKAGGTPTVNNTAGAGNVPTAGSVLINGANSTSTLAGSIAATRLSANQSAGFSVVTWTGNGSTSSSVTIGHGLGVAPSMIIIKKRSSGTDYGWSTWHTSLGGNYGIWLNQTSARNPAMWAGYTNISSTVFSPADLLYTNESGQTYVTYCFANVSGYSSAFSYTGNGSSDGPMVNLSFRPRWILIKRTDSTGNWLIWDASRNTYNLADLPLYPNLTNIEGAEPTRCLDALSNGFKLRGTGTDINASGSNYIGFAVAENPFKYSRAR